MKSLREKWIEFYPVMFGIAFIIAMIWIVILGINKMGNAIEAQSKKPDPRTVDEILLEKYKTCIRFAQVDDFNECKVYLNAQKLDD